MNYSELEHWLNQILTRPIPPETAALHFNLYDDGEDTWSIELVGTDRFDPADDDWPCYEIFDFGTREDPLPWHQAESWDKILEQTVGYLQKYLAEGAHADILKHYQGVGIGFVDGDVKILFQK